MRAFERGDRVRARGLTVEFEDQLVVVDMVGTFKGTATLCAAEPIAPVMAVVVGDDGREIWVQPDGRENTIDAILTLLDPSP